MEQGLGEDEKARNERRYWEVMQWLAEWADETEAEAESVGR